MDAREDRTPGASSEQRKKRWRDALYTPRYTAGVDALIDPSAAAIEGVAVPLKTDRYHIFAAVIPTKTTVHYVFDIETWRLKPHLLHFGVGMALGNNTPVFMRTWESVETWLIDIAQAHAQEAKDHGETGAKIKVWAHNGSHFDWLGLAHHLKIGHGLVYEATSRRADCNIRYTIRTEKKGNRQYISCGFSVQFRTGRKLDGKKIFVRVQLVDSIFHLATSLKNLGAKGITPLQYTQPKKWLAEQEALGLKDPAADGYQYWYDHVDPKALEYCVNDCVVLSDALISYRDNINTLFKFDALDILTGPKTALCAVISSYPTFGKAKTPDHVTLFKPGKSTEWRIYDSGEDWRQVEEEAKKKRGEEDKITAEIYVDRPFMASGELRPAISSTAWYVAGHVASLYQKVQFGGRCEVFAPRNRPGTKMLTIDAASMYPSQQALQRYVDPRFFGPLRADIVGRAAILEFLVDRSGMFLIESAPSLAPYVQKYPVFPVRVSGDIPEDRLIFPHWSGVMRHYVSGEELRYFLECGEVEGDNITVKAGSSWHAALLPMSETPQGNFCRMLYGKRKDAKDKIKSAKTEAARSAARGLSETAKILLNSGGYGVLVQSQESSTEISALDKAGIAAYIETLEEMDPLWSGWGDTERNINTIQKYMSEHYLPFSTYVTEAGGKSYVFGLAERLAGHAIRPWGAQITAYARVALHKAITAAKRAGFGVLYCDTDSVHMSVPEDMDPDQVRELLTAQGLVMGNELGAWDTETDSADPALITPDSDVNADEIINGQGFYLAPKCYHHTDKKGNVLHSTMKGISRTVPMMRSILYGFTIVLPKLDERHSHGLGLPQDRDAMPGIGKRCKRNFETQYDSEPLIFEQWDNPHASWGEYIRHYGNNFGERAGIAAALDEYKRCRVQGKTVELQRHRMQTAYQKAMRQGLMLLDGEIDDYDLENVIEMLEDDYLLDIYADMDDQAIR